MSIKQTFEQRQQHSLHMTAQLQQAIKLLEYSSLDLRTYLEDAALENPILTVEDPEESLPDSLSPQEISAANDTSEPDSDYDTLWTNQDREPTSKNPLHETSSPGSAIDRIPASSGTLRDHLMSQLNTDLPHPTDRLIGASLIDSLDESGYLTEDISQIAQKLGCDAHRIEETLKKLQQFDPPGIFARSLSECLKLQLQDQGLCNTAIEAFLENLDLLAQGKIDTLQKITGFSSGDTQALVKKIKSLNPKPALQFNVTPSQVVIPDVILTRKEGGAWQARLNETALPKVIVNDQYYDDLLNHIHGPRDSAYLKDRLQNANWLVKALAQRADTILKVSKAIIEEQHNFFAYGIRYLRPMVLREIAESVEMHESTISRVTNNKYIATPRGIFELKYFFSSALSGVNSDQKYSSESVRHRIQELVYEEEASDPLSDDKIVEKLSEEGIHIARRTVAKYRDTLHIPSSYQRRMARRRGF